MVFLEKQKERPDPDARDPDARVTPTLDPDVIVLGGGMSNITRLYENVPKLWGKYVCGYAAGKKSAWRFERGAGRGVVVELAKI